MKRLVVSWPGDGLAEKLASVLNCEYDTYMSGKFADTETTISHFPTKHLNKHEIIVVASYRFWDSEQQQAAINDQLFATWYVLHFLKQAGIPRIVLVLPYLPYMRAQGRHHPEEVSFLEFMIGIFHHAGVDLLITCDIHQDEVLRRLSLPIHVCRLTQFWKSVIEEHILPVYPREKICLVSPDLGGIDRVRLLAHCFNIEPVILLKKRTSETDRELVLSHEIKGKVVIIVDDILDTGATATQSAALLSARGAEFIIGFFSHAIFSQGAAQRVYESCFDRIFVADTVCLDSCLLPPVVVRLSVQNFLAHEIAYNLQQVK